MKLKKLMLLISLVLFISSISMAQTFKYVGVKGCKICHMNPAKGNQYKIWEDGPHAKAMESLKGDEKTDPKCIKCHSTAASVDKSLLAGLTVDEGVSCESCHGPGSAYKNMAVMKNLKMAESKGLIMPDEKVCKQCHNEESPNYKGFNFEEYAAKIAHPDPTLKK